MFHKQANPAPGKFLLTIRTPFGPQFYQESGVVGVGTAHEGQYLHWTKYQKHAYAFTTLKTARAMVAKLLAEHDIRATIVNRDGEVIC